MHDVHRVRAQLVCTVRIRCKSRTNAACVRVLCTLKSYMYDRVRCTSRTSAACVQCTRTMYINIINMYDVHIVMYIVYVYDVHRVRAQLVCTIRVRCTSRTSVACVHCTRTMYIAYDCSLCTSSREEEHFCGVVRIPRRGLKFELKCLE